MRYETLDLRIAQEAPGRLVVWADWAHGHGSDRVVLEVPELERELRRVTEGRAGRGDLTALGTRLFQRLFQSEDSDVGEQLNQCWGAAKKDRLHGIRVRLRFDEPEVGAIPWEFLYWPTRGAFFATSPRMALERYLEVPDILSQPRVELPVRVLVVAPRMPDLDTATEIRSLQGIFDGLDGVEHRVLEGRVDADALRSALADDEFHVLHFIGHGGVDDAGPFLLMGEGLALDDGQLAGVVEAHLSLQLVVLNSCQGAVGSPSGPFVGMAQRLVSRGLPAVLAMQFAIYDRVAATFSLAFYRSLFQGRHRGDVEVATAQARSALATDYPDTPAFATPVLFLHTEDGVLFDLLSGRFRQDVPLSVERAHLLRSVERTVEKNLSLRERTAASPPTPPEARAIADDRAALVRIRRRLRTGMVLGLLPVAVALTVFLGSLLYVMDRFSRWARLETVTVRVAELFDDTRLDERLAIVAIDADDVRREGEAFGPEWRPRLAELVDRLSEVGASVIALDLAFNAVTDDDSVLAAAFARARERGSRALVTATHFEGGELFVAPALRPHVTPGIACGRTGAQQLLDLVVRKADASAEGRTVPSFALRVVAAAEERRIADVDLARRRVVLDGPAGRREIAFAATDRVVSEQPGCEALGPGDTVATLVVDYSAPGALRRSDRRYGFTEIVRSTALPDQLAGKLVVVGSETGDIVVSLYPGVSRERRYGFEVIADAVNTMLAGTTIVPLGGLPLFLLILASAGVGGVVAIYPAGAYRWQRAALVVGACLVLFLAGVAAYRFARLMIMVVYPILGLVLGFWATHRFDRWRLT